MVDPYVGTTKQEDKAHPDAGARLMLERVTPFTNP